MFVTSFNLLLFDILLFYMQTPSHMLHFTDFDRRASINPTGRMISSFKNILLAAFVSNKQLAYYNPAILAILVVIELFCKEDWSYSYIHC